MFALSSLSRTFIDDNVFNSHDLGVIFHPRKATEYKNKDSVIKKNLMAKKRKMSVDVFYFIVEAFIETWKAFL